MKKKASKTHDKHLIEIECKYYQLYENKVHNQINNLDNKIDKDLNALYQRFFILEKAHNELREKFLKLENNMPIFSRFYEWLRSKGFIKKLDE